LFSVRWTGQFDFGAGYYQFTARVDDGIRVWLDGTPVIDGWRDQTLTTYQTTSLVAAGTHQVKVEYYEKFSTASVQLSWQAAGSTSCPSGQYLAEYYNNRTLSGTPTFTRCEAGPINSDWGLGGPGNGLANDQFSVRWTGQFDFGAGDYKFTATVDDGMRVWVDGNSVIDAWRDQRATYQTPRTLSGGTHEVKVEYYENSGAAVAQLNWQAQFTPRDASDAGATADRESQPAGTATSPTRMMPGTPSIPPSVTTTSSATPTSSPAMTITPLTLRSPTATSSASPTATVTQAASATMAGSMGGISLTSATPSATPTPTSTGTRTSTPPGTPSGSTP
jgi:hypothetical protein